MHTQQITNTQLCTSSNENIRLTDLSISHKKPNGQHLANATVSTTATVLPIGYPPQQQPPQQQQQKMQQMRTVPQAKPQYKCNQCNIFFGSKSAHTSHIKSHGKLNDLNATNPDTSTTTASADPYQCDVCKKTFAVPARLVRHYRTHTGERPFECEFCHKMFSVKENLQVHRRIHTKERPYKCDVCGRAFEHSGKLHRHMRIHTGERPHRCSVCNKTFIQSGQLVIHMRTHTGEIYLFIYILKFLNSHQFVYLSK